MPINDCQLNEMFENYYRYLEFSTDDDKIDAFQMSETLAVLLNVSKEWVIEKYIVWCEVYKR